MTNKETREEFKKLVIMGNHPEAKTYNEALEKELGPGCRVVKLNSNAIGAGDICTIMHEECKNTYWAITEDESMTYVSWDRFRIIGQPITIGRVMYVLPGKHHKVNKWKLTHNNRESTDEDQDIETIKALVEVLR